MRIGEMITKDELSLCIEGCCVGQVVSSCGDVVWQWVRLVGMIYTCRKIGCTSNRSIERTAVRCYSCHIHTYHPSMQ